MHGATCLRVTHLAKKASCTVDPDLHEVESYKEDKNFAHASPKIDIMLLQMLLQYVNLSAICSGQRFMLVIMLSFAWTIDYISCHLACNYVITSLKCYLFAMI